MNIEKILEYINSKTINPAVLKSMLLSLPREEALDTSDATAAANDILKGKTAYINGKKVVGTLELPKVEVKEEEK